MEYQQAARMQDLQCFILDLEEGMKRAPIFYLVQKVLLCILIRKTFCTEMQL
jgi:hypothetical protein